MIKKIIFVLLIVGWLLGYGITVKSSDSRWHLGVVNFLGGTAWAGCPEEPPPDPHPPHPDDP